MSHILKKQDDYNRSWLTVAELEPVQQEKWREEAITSRDSYMNTRMLHQKEKKK